MHILSTSLTWEDQQFIESGGGLVALVRLVTLLCKLAVQRRTRSAVEQGEKMGVSESFNSLHRIVSCGWTLFHDWGVPGTSHSCIYPESNQTRCLSM